jgi:hypothetical protein
LGYDYWTSGKSSTLSGKTPGCGIGNWLAWMQL